MKFNVWHLNELRTVPHELSVLSSRVWRQELWRIPLLSTFIFQTQTPFWTKLRVSIRSTTLQICSKKFTCLVRRSDTGFHPWVWGNKPVSRFIRTNRHFCFFSRNLYFRISIISVFFFSEQKSSFLANHHFWYSNIRGALSSEIIIFSESSFYRIGTVVHCIGLKYLKFLARMGFVPNPPLGGWVPRRLYVLKRFGAKT